MPFLDDLLMNIKSAAIYLLWLVLYISCNVGLFTIIHFGLTS